MLPFQAGTMEASFLELAGWANTLFAVSFSALFLLLEYEEFDGHCVVSHAGLVDDPDWSHKVLDGSQGGSAPQTQWVDHRLAAHPITWQPFLNPILLPQQS